MVESELEDDAGHMPLETGAALQALDICERSRHMVAESGSRNTIQ